MLSKGRSSSEPSKWHVPLRSRLLQGSQLLQLGALTYPPKGADARFSAPEKGQCRQACKDKRGHRIHLNQKLGLYLGFPCLDLPFKIVAHLFKGRQNSVSDQVNLLIISQVYRAVPSPFTFFSSRMPSLCSLTRTCASVSAPVTWPRVSRSLRPLRTEKPPPTVCLESETLSSEKHSPSTQSYFLCGLRRASTAGQGGPHTLLPASRNFKCSRLSHSKALPS